MGKAIDEMIAEVEKNNNAIAKILTENARIVKDLRNRSDEDWEWVAVSTACRMWQVSPAYMYQRINSGKLKSRRFENKLYVSMAELRAINDKVSEC